MSQWDFLESLHLLGHIVLGVEGDLSVQLMEHQNVQAANSVAFIECLRALLIETLKSLKVGPIDWWTEGLL